MKKFFTLISMALVAMSVNAQTSESWKASSLSFNVLFFKNIPAPYTDKL